MPTFIISLWSVETGCKSDLLGCLESCLEKEHNIAQPDTDAVIFDRSVILNMLKPVTVKLFQEYALNVFMPHIQRYLEKSHRVDIVWDQYLENSINFQAREKRGKGIR